MEIKEVDYINNLIKNQSTNVRKWAVKNKKDIYFDNWDYIIQETLNDQYLYDTYKTLLLLTTKELNIFKRVINEIALVYYREAKRKAVIGNEEEEIIEDQVYKELMENSMIDIIMKTVNKMTEITNNTIVRPVWRDGSIDYDLFTFDNIEILTDKEDWKKIIAVKYYINLELPFYDGINTETGTAKMGNNNYTTPSGAINNQFGAYSYSYLWTLENKDKTTGKYRNSYIYKFKKINNSLKEEMIEKKVNPYVDLEGYPILPFVLFCKNYPIDDLLDFTTGDDLLDLTIQIAIEYVNYNVMKKYNSWRQKYVITNDPDSIPNDLSLSPERVAVFPKRIDSSVEVGIWDQESDLKSFFDTIINRITLAVAQYGLDAESFQRSGSAESGIKLKIKKEGLIERREEKLPLYREYEKQLFELTRIVNNYHNPNKIDINAEFKIDFSDIKTESDPMESANVWTSKIQNNVASPIDWIMQENEDLDEDEAMLVYEKNKAINGKNLGNIPINPFQRRPENAINQTEERQQQENQREGSK